MIEVVLAKPEHAAVLGANLREGDRQELAAWGVTGEEGVWQSIDNAFVSYVCLEDGVPIAGWGARHGGLLSGYADLWCLTTPRVAHYRKQILRFSRQFVAAMQELYPTLEALVDARYEQAVRWVRWLGFKDADTVQVNGCPFIAFKRERS